MREEDDVIEVVATVEVPIENGKSRIDSCLAAQERLKKTGINVVINIPGPES